MCDKIKLSKDLTLYVTAQKNISDRDYSYYLSLDDTEENEIIPSAKIKIATHKKRDEKIIIEYSAIIKSTIYRIDDCENGNLSEFSQLVIDRKLHDILKMIKAWMV